jgi:hypothetical protein
MRRELMAKKSENQEEKTVKKRLYKLRDPSTQYAERSFTLIGQQKKELPGQVSPELLARIRSGFIVEVSESTKRGQD